MCDNGYEWSSRVPGEKSNKIESNIKNLDGMSKNLWLSFTCPKPNRRDSGTSI